MSYTEKKYVVDCLKYNYRFKFIDHELNFYDLEGNEVSLKDIVEYLFDNFEMDFKIGMETIVRWSQGDIHADMMSREMDLNLNDYQ